MWGFGAQALFLGNGAGYAPGHFQTSVNYLGQYQATAPLEVELVDQFILK